MNEQGKINVAIIGCNGYIAQVYKETLQHICREERGYIDLLCGVDITAEKEDRNAQFPIFATIEEMKNFFPEVNAVCILTPPETHQELIEQALFHDLHVLVEKPPALSSEDCLSIAALAAQSPNQLYFAWHVQHVTGMEKLRAELRTQTLERFEIIYTEDVRNYRTQSEPNLFPGALLDSGINALSALTRFKLFKPEDLVIQSAEFQNHRHQDIDVTWDIVFNLGTFKQDWLCNKTRRLIKIFTAQHNVYVINVHSGYILKNNEMFAKEEFSNTMFGEYYRQCRDWIKRLRQNRSYIHFAPIAIAEMVKSSSQGGQVVC